MSLVNWLLGIFGYEIVQVPIERDEDETDLVQIESDEGWEDLDQVAYKIQKKA